MPNEPFRTTFLDRLIRQGSRPFSMEVDKLQQWRGAHDDLAELLPYAQVFDITNVYEYLNTMPRFPGIASLTGLIPPFRETWFEWHAPGDKRPGESFGTGLWEGVLMNAFRNTDGSWMVLGHLYVAESGFAEIRGPVHSSCWMVNAEGRVDAGSEARSLLWARAEGSPLSSVVTSWIPLVCMALQLMVCKNVVTVEHPAPERAARAYTKRHGVAPVVWRTLDIVPMRTEIRRDATARGEKETYEGAMRLIRGHPKTFDEDKPLFGKHTGTWWWEPQVRGSAEAGVVNKQYRVRKPKQEVER